LNGIARRVSPANGWIRIFWSSNPTENGHLAHNDSSGSLQVGVVMVKCIANSIFDKSETGGDKRMLKSELNVINDGTANKYCALPLAGLSTFPSMLQ
jgi:hypothetical protein